MQISIIIPIYNAEKYLEKLIESLLNQNYEGDFEIITVNNNSSDKSKEILDRYKDKIVYLEQNEIASSYVSRNVGIKKSKGDILAFIDADCIADKSWLKNGEKSMKEKNADLVGGEVKFYFSKKPKLAEYFDSIAHFQFKKTAKNQHSVGGGNLIVKKEIFNKIGLFPNVKSGGDFQWTNKAYNAGYKLIYSEDVIVYHPTRKLNELLHKQLRLGSSLRSHKKLKTNYTLNKKSFWERISPFYSFKKIKELAKGNENEEIINKKIFKIWLVASLCKTTKLIGYFLSFFGYKHR
ncbi:MAG: glycosyltransferase [Parcubacteria group bacterium]